MKINPTSATRNIQYFLQSNLTVKMVKASLTVENTSCASLLGDSQERIDPCQMVPFDSAELGGSLASTPLSQRVWALQEMALELDCFH
jgi:hypothetical protein